MYIWHKAQQIVNSLSFCPVLYISIHLFERVKWQMGMANGNPNNLSTLADSVIYLKSFISFHFISAWEDHQIRSSLGILLVSALLNWWSFIVDSFSFFLSLSCTRSLEPSSTQVIHTHVSCIIILNEFSQNKCKEKYLTWHDLACLAFKKMMNSVYCLQQRWAVVYSTDDDNDTASVDTIDPKLRIHTSLQANGIVK